MEFLCYPLFFHIFNKAGLESVPSDAASSRLLILTDAKHKQINRERPAPSSLDKL